MTVFDLGDVIAYFTPAGPQDPPVLTGPWQPHTTDELIAQSQRTRAELARAVEKSRRARDAYDLPEVA